MELVENIKERFSFYKENDTDKMYRVDFPDMDGWLAVSFDKKKVLFLYKDYPQNFSKEEKAIFEKEEPFWASFFKNGR